MKASRGTVGVYWGRFNPPHKGHMRMIKRFAKRVDILMVVIGSAKHKNEKQNPFSGSERKRMLNAYLSEEGVKKASVLVNEDGHASYSSALGSLVRNCKPDVLFLPANEKPELLKAARSELEGRVRVVAFKRAKIPSSTLLRDAIASGRRWEHLTGGSVAALITEFDGISRIKRAYDKRHRGR